jgi:CBS domain-containing protein
MNVQSCMTENVQLVSPSESIRDAAQIMKDADVGLLPVGEDDRLVGMITDRDIAVRAVADGMDPDTPVREVMSEEVLYCFEDDEIEDAAIQMEGLQVRRLPVLSRDKRLVGIISLADISQADNDDGVLSATALSGISIPGGSHVQR